jgi:invasion protein IalB
MKTHNLRYASACVFFLATVLPSEAVTRVQKTFENWQVDCSDQTNTNRCSLRFALINNKTKRIVFAWTIVPKSKPGGPNKVVIRTPMGVALADGISITFPDQKPVVLSYLTCLQRTGCIAEIDYSDDWNKLLISYPSMTIRYKSLRGKPLKHVIKLKKFSEAYKYYNTQSKSK